MKTSTISENNLAAMDEFLRGEGVPPSADRKPARPVVPLRVNIDEVERFVAPRSKQVAEIKERQKVETRPEIDITGVERFLKIYSAPVFEAVMLRDMEKLRAAADECTDMNVRDQQGISPVMWSGALGWFEGSEFLAEKGVRLNSKDNRDTTVLMFGSWGGEARTMDLFLRKTKADGLNEVDFDLWSALMYASHRGKLAAARMLVAAGADRDLVNDEGKSALYYARENQDKRMIELLESGKPDPVEMNLASLFSR
jgi:hypothetical protein